MATRSRSTVDLEDVRRPLDLRQVARGWHSNNRECSYWVPEADVEGTIPSELRGTLFRNGPGLLEVYGKKLIHRELLNLATP
jgi:all-trans-8'-apo-beta-carotenal 15,15'-oxygenase